MPELFAISIQAVRPRPQTADELMSDIMIDSVLLRRLPADSGEMLLFQPGTWVSYPSVSPDTLVKRFKPVQSGYLVWRKIPKSTKLLEMTLYARTAEGRLGTQSRTGVSVPIDTVMVARLEAYSRQELAVLTVRTDQRFFQFGYQGLD